MSRLTMTIFATLDGVVQAPGGPREDPSGGFDQGGWVVPLVDEDFLAFVTEVFSRAGGFLLGRRTYEMFADHWPHVTDPGDRVAAALNSLPKYVASRTLQQVTWSETTIVRDVPGEVARLKAQVNGELQVHGSGALAQTLFAHGLVDELNVLQFPLVLGRGKRLFEAGTAPTAFELVKTRTTRSGVLIGTFRPAGRPAFGSAELENGATRLR